MNEGSVVFCEREDVTIVVVSSLDSVTFAEVSVEGISASEGTAAAGGSVSLGGGSLGVGGLGVG